MAGVRSSSSDNGEELFSPTAAHIAGARTLHLPRRFSTSNLLWTVSRTSSVSVSIEHD
jgi:hypothetical protein